MDKLSIKIIIEKIQKYKKIIISIFVFFFLIFISYYLFLSANTEKETIIHISSSDTLSKITKDFEAKKIINNPFLFKVLVRTLSGDKNITKGDYLFKKNISLIGVIWQVSRGKHNINPIKITLKEGITNVEIANLFSSKITGFDKDLFLNDSRSKEGYLFPDTYFFYPLSTTNEILTELTLNFKKKITSIDKDIKASGKNISDIIIMASILEKEAKGKNDGAIISGILWKRIELGMLLQVDAAPVTYDIRGLPENPICNPGLSSILYAIKPEKSQYLFYLHDDNGQVHYAVNFSEHKSNIAHYLK